MTNVTKFDIIPSKILQAEFDGEKYSTKRLVCQTNLVMYDLTSTKRFCTLLVLRHILRILSKQGSRNEVAKGYRFDM